MRLARLTAQQGGGDALAGFSPTCSPGDTGAGGTVVRAEFSVDHPVEEAHMADPT